MGRPASGLDEYLDWQERLESYKSSGLSVDEFCLSEGIAKSNYYRWLDRLKNGLPEEMVEESAARKRIESGGAAFVPISLKASRILTTQSTYKAIAGRANGARSTGTM